MPKRLRSMGGNWSRLTPENFEGWFNLGLARQMLNRLEEADASLHPSHQNRAGQSSGESQSWQSFWSCAEISRARVVELEHVLRHRSAKTRARCGIWR